jgi:hypothetical protein
MGVIELITKLPDIMEPKSIILIVMIGFISVIALLIGYQIKHGQAFEAISLPNLHLRRVIDRACFCRFIGSRVMGIGFLGLVTAALHGIVPSLTHVALLIFILGTALVSIQAVLFHKRYM